MQSAAVAQHLFPVDEHLAPHARRATNVRDGAYAEPVRGYARRATQARGPRRCRVHLVREEGRDVSS